MELKLHSYSAVKEQGVAAQRKAANIQVLVQWKLYLY
jgi:hypothetical protein